MELIIGTKRWSSWSLRAWLAMKRTGAAFTETLVPLYEREVQPELARHSPSKLVPVLKDGELTVWDSLAICEYLHEQFPQARLWPQDAALRAIGRSAAAEMHSGFQALRQECPMDLQVRTKAALSEKTQADVRRLVGLWSELLARSGGPFLLGDWSIADAFYTPVATRFRSYGVELKRFGDAGEAETYSARLLAATEFRSWEAGAGPEATPPASLVARGPSSPA
ncbi:MAG TPA: glutathione S-transferase family protein [Caulobacteraceae bacterium]